MLALCGVLMCCLEIELPGPMCVASTMFVVPASFGTCRRQGIDIRHGTHYPVPR